ncbi:putative RNA methyltransferase [Atopomonas sediminilitoris]|uniref:putative RNA methyltransferase n=1 Tax=Atopomonas sediminilitoris TaxID=2919919 RepID=UPI001F4D8586|nr:methyltransferase domain-containing protein [Atopomonas sediminilitoris]MCJ8168853.1 methyltransferase domain-containing protein [Atopomonas sediminilitoris]
MQLTCPLCQQALALSEQGLACTHGHRFDRARQGYYNLLPVQHKNSRAPGDNPQMVEARRRFLAAGHYAPLAAGLVERAQQLAPATWLDIGCGEGYYTAEVAQALPSSDGHALDISRDAVKRACRLAPDLTWMVASMARVPMPSASCDVLLSVFSPLDYPEAARLLKPGGHLLRLGPASAHLMELREKIYDQVRPYDDAKHLTNLPNNWDVVDTGTVSFNFTLENPADRADLLAMTPHGWRASEEKRQAVIEQTLVVQVAARYDIVQRLSE